MRAARMLGVITAVAGLLAAACGGGASTGSSGAGERVGRAAPDFTLRSASAPTVSLSQFRAKKPVLLYFSMGPG